MEVKGQGFKHYLFGTGPARLSLVDLCLSGLRKHLGEQNLPEKGRTKHQFAFYQSSKRFQCEV